MQEAYKNYLVDQLNKDIQKTQKQIEKNKKQVDKIDNKLDKLYQVSGLSSKSSAYSEDKNNEVSGPEEEQTIDAKTQEDEQ